MSTAKYRIITFGCQMNKSDSERIAAVLELAGLSPATDINRADLLIINSCSVRQSAINRIFGLLNNLKKKRKLRFCHPERSPAMRGRSLPAGRQGSRPLSNNRTDNNHGISASGGSAEGMTSVAPLPQNDNLKTILTGCILEADKKKLADKFDLIIDIKELTQKPKKLIEFLRLENQEFKAFDYTDYFKINPQYRSKFSAYVPIMTGCNNFCAYCAVPYTRGREISRPAEEIIAEIKKLIEKGYKEITLLGQNVNSYKSEIQNPPQSPFNKGGEKEILFSEKTDNGVPPLKKGARGISGKTEIEKIDFPKLLKLINNIPGDFWIRFLTSHPKDMSDKLIKTMVKCEKVTEYVHLPIQSGDNDILRKMNRHYTQEQYLALIDKIELAYACHPERSPAGRSEGSGANARSRAYTRDSSTPLRSAQNDSVWHPPIAISTDIIVGFPGETKKQFTDTVRLMRRVKFDMAYLSEYSPRAGTAAAKLKDTVAIAEKKQRKEYLNEVLRKTALANNKKYVGKTVDVLIEKINDGFIFGKTRTFKNVKIPLTVIARNNRRERRSHVSGRSAEGGQSRVNLNKSRDCRSFRLPDEKLAMTILQPGQFACIKITQAGAWGLEGEIIKNF